MMATAQARLAAWLFGPADSRTGTWLRATLGGLLLYAYWPVGRSHRYEGALGDGPAWQALYGDVFLTSGYRWVVLAGIVVFMLGWRIRWVGPVLAVLLLPYCFLQSGQQSRQLWVACVVCVSLLPSRAFLGGRTEVDPAGPVWPLRLLQLQLTAVYAINALYKSTPEFLSGDVLAALSTRPNFWVNMSDGYLHAGAPAVPAGWLAVATVIIEYWLAAGLWWRRTLVFTAVLGVAFHIGLKFIMRIHMLDIATLYLYFAFLIPVASAGRGATGDFGGCMRKIRSLLSRPAVLHGHDVRRADGRIEVSARLERGGESHRLKVSAPEWAGAWIDETYDALVLAALPWAEAEGVALRVRGPVSAGLLAGLRRRRWLRGRRGVAVRAESVAVREAGRREGAVLHYTGDLFAVASALELAEGHDLYPRPALAVGAGAVPGGEAGALFLEKLGLRYADVRVERPGPETAEGGDVDGAVRLRFLSGGFGTGYLPATAAYRYAEAEGGEPDADLDPLFSGGGMRVVHHGAERALPGTLTVVRGSRITVPPLVAVRTKERAPAVLVAAGLALGRATQDGAEGNLEFDRKRVRWHALDVLRWLRAEPELAATAEGRALAGRLRRGLGLAEGAALPKAEAHRSPLGAAVRPPGARTNRAWWPRRAEWEGGLALVSDDRRLVRLDLEPIASWLRLRNPLLRAGAERTQALVKAVKNRGLKKPAWMVGMHPMPSWATGTSAWRAGLDAPKSEELAGLERAGVAVPRWRVLQPGESLGEAEFGRYVVVKPDQGLRGARVRVEKATSVKGDPIFVEAIKTHSAPLVQEFIYTGPRPVSHRVGVMFGKAIYRWRIEGREVEGRALPADGDFRASSGLSVVSSGKGCAFTDPFDPEVTALAEKAARAFPEVPLMGVDVVRRMTDGKLFVLELNACGYCFHLTSATGVKVQSTTWLELPEQYGGYPYIADLYRLAYEREHGW